MECTEDGDAYASCIIEATVPTGFETLAAEEAKEVFNTECRSFRGKIQFEVPVNRVKEITDLGGIDHCRAQIHHVPCFGFTDNGDECLARLCLLVKDGNWTEGLKIWSMFHSFPYPISPKPQREMRDEELIDVVHSVFMPGQKHKQEAGDNSAEGGEKKKGRGGGRKRDRRREKDKSRKEEEGENAKDATVSGLTKSESQEAEEDEKQESEEGEELETEVDKQQETAEDKQQETAEDKQQETAEDKMPETKEDVKQEDAGDKEIAVDENEMDKRSEDTIKPRKTLCHENEHEEQSSENDMANQKEVQLTEAEVFPQVHHSLRPVSIPTETGDAGSDAPAQVCQLAEEKAQAMKNIDPSSDPAVPTSSSPVETTSYDTCDSVQIEHGQDSVDGLQPVEYPCGGKVEGTVEGSSVDPVQAQLQLAEHEAEMHGTEMTKAIKADIVEEGQKEISAAPQSATEYNSADESNSLQQKTRKKREIDPTKPAFRVTCKRNGEFHSFDSMSAAASFGSAVQKYFGWNVDMTNFNIEIVLTIDNNDVSFGLALTPESLHKRNVVAFGVTTLRPTICHNMLRMVKVRPGHVVCDPLCGTGSISIQGAQKFPAFQLCGDNSKIAMEKTLINKDAMNEKRNKEGRGGLMMDAVKWNARHLPLRDGIVDVFVTDLPFGKRLGKKENNCKLYCNVLDEMARCSKDGGRAALLTGDIQNMQKAVNRQKYWSRRRVYSCSIGGIAACVFLLFRDKVPYVNQVHGNWRAKKKQDVETANEETREGENAEGGCSDEDDGNEEREAGGEFVERALGLLDTDEQPPESKLSTPAQDAVPYNSIAVKDELSEKAGLEKLVSDNLLNETIMSDDATVIKGVFNHNVSVNIFDNIPDNAYLEKDVLEKDVLEVSENACIEKVNAEALVSENDGTEKAVSVAGVTEYKCAEKGICDNVLSEKFSDDVFYDNVASEKLFSLPYSFGKDAESYDADKSNSGTVDIRLPAQSIQIIISDETEGTNTQSPPLTLDNIEPTNETFNCPTESEDRSAETSEISMVITVSVDRLAEEPITQESKEDKTVDPTQVKDVTMENVPSEKSIEEVAFKKLFTSSGASIPAKDSTKSNGEPYQKEVSSVPSLPSGDSITATKAGPKSPKKVNKSGKSSGSSSGGKKASGKVKGSVNILTDAEQKALQTVIQGDLHQYELKAEKTLQSKDGEHPLSADIHHHHHFHHHHHHYFHHYHHHDTMTPSAMPHTDQSIISQGPRILSGQGEVVGDQGRERLVEGQQVRDTRSRGKDTAASQRDHFSPDHGFAPAGSMHVPSGITVAGGINIPVLANLTRGFGDGLPTVAQQRHENRNAPRHADLGSFGLLSGHAGLLGPIPQAGPASSSAAGSFRGQGHLDVKQQQGHQGNRNDQGGYFGSRGNYRGLGSRDRFYRGGYQANRSGFRYRRRDNRDSRFGSQDDESQFGREIAGRGYREGQGQGGRIGHGYTSMRGVPSDDGGATRQEGDRDRREDWAGRGGRKDNRSRHRERRSTDAPK